MSRDSSAKSYQDNKERLQKRFVMDIKVFLKKKNKISDNIFVIDINIFQKIKNKG